MRSSEEVRRILAETDPSVRTLYAVAVLAEEAQVPGENVIVVGGSAVEVYTQAGYVSGDIDLVGDRKRLVAVAKRWGFKWASRQLWINSEWGLAFEFVKDLKLYNGRLELTRIIDTPFGPVRVEAPEDSVVRRLIQAKHWQVRTGFDEAVAVAVARVDGFDWDYARTYARREEVLDLLEELRRRVAMLAREGGAESATMT